MSGDTAAIAESGTGKGRLPSKVRGCSYVYAPFAGIEYPFDGLDSSAGVPVPATLSEIGIDVAAQF
jgi:hypothetical protein